MSTAINIYILHVQEECLRLQEHAFLINFEAIDQGKLLPHVGGKGLRGMHSAEVYDCADYNDIARHKV